uniref:Uncharacterized mitochondrial protein ORF4A/ORF4B n=1 Tax=Ascobolus immersus TaxID=5191 RepID=YPA4_ASCIM
VGVRSYYMKYIIVGFTLPRPHNPPAFILSFRPKRINTGSYPPIQNCKFLIADGSRKVFT